jgi:hypothetical protein
MKPMTRPTQAPYRTDAITPERFWRRRFPKPRCLVGIARTNRVSGI